MQSQVPANYDDSLSHNTVAAEGISIIICCYNSANLLPETIRHLGLMEVNDKINWEVIVVDNASTDNTGTIAVNEWTKTNCNRPFRVIKQPVPGLTNAIMAGINHSAYNYYLLVDDDNWLDKSFLNTAYDIMHYNPAIGILGSIGTPCFETGEGPKWFPEFQRYFAVGAQSDNTGDVTLTSGWVYGACSLIRGDAWKKLMDNSFRFLATDRSGTNLSSGGDIERCNAIRMAGYQIWYNNSLKFTHFIPVKKCTWAHLKKLSAGMGASKLQNEAYNNVFSLNLNNINQVKSFLWLRTALHVLIGLFKKFPSYIAALMGREGSYHEIEFLFEWARFKQYFVLRGTYTAFHKQVIDLKKRLSSS